MRLFHIHRALLRCVAGFGLLASMGFAQGQSNFAKQIISSACPNNDSALKIPPGFCATVFADGIGHARHLVVSASGLVYVNTWSSPYYGRDVPHPGGFLEVLQDKNRAGKAEVIERFGETTQSGGTGGTGIALYQGWLYAGINDRIARYPLSAGSIVPSGRPETIVSGLPLEGDHPMHPFIIDSKGSMYIDVATATNACQVKNRQLESPGMSPCTELETVAGSGVMTRIRQTRSFHRRNDTRRAYAMRKALLSIPVAGCL
jgi:glucose/arabinose dehydrogenase